MLNTHLKAATMGPGAVLSMTAVEECLLQTRHRGVVEI